MEYEERTQIGYVDCPSDIGIAVRVHRLHRGLSQIELAELAKVGRRFVIDLEGGKETVQAGCLFKVCHALDLEVMLRRPIPNAAMVARQPLNRISK